MIHLYGIFKIDKIIEQNVVARVGGKGERGISSNEYGYFFWGSEEYVLELGNGSFYHLVNILKISELYALKGWILWYLNYISIFLKRYLDFALGSEHLAQLDTLWVNHLTFAQRTELE